MKELATLLPFLRRYGVHISVGLLMVLVANGFSVATPYLIREAIDHLALPDADARGILRYVFLILGFALLGGIARYAMRELLNGVSRRVEFDLRNRLFEQLLRLDASFFGRMPTGDIMSRATNDISAVRMVAGPAYMYLTNTIVVSILAIGLMIWIDPRLTLVTMIPLILLPPITIRFGRLIHDRFEAIQERFGRMTTTVQENLAGVRLVRAYGQEERQISRFDEQAHDYLDRNVALARISGLFHPLLGLFSGLALALALLLGGRAVMEGRLSIGDFVAFLLYLGMLTWPMIALGWVINLFQRGAASMRRINEILESEPLVRDLLPAGNRLPFPPEWSPAGDVEFRDVTFRYPGTDREVLQEISFQIPAGTTLALVGATGSGKSTIVRLLARLYEPSSGEILLDGVPLQHLPLDRVRALIGMVPQDPFLFSDTIRENLGFGLDATDTLEADLQIRDASRIANLEEAVENFPNGLETLLGERGVNLSGGQKQRATLARAVARNPRLLVLDDALSAVDTRTEAAILRALRSVFRDRTSIVVSHRVSAVMGADLILVLDEGRIIERGRHEELLASGGLYARLLRRQILEEEVGADALARSPGGL